MDKIPKKGFAYIKEFREEKEKPSIDSEFVGMVEKGDTVHYDGVEQNEFGVWIILREDNKKKYILVIDENNKCFANLPIIHDGEYLIQPLEYKDKVLDNNNGSIIINEISIDEKQKFNFQFISEDNCYRIICVGSNNSLELNLNEGNKLKECEIFSDNEIKWKINKNNLKEFCLEDSKTNLLMEYSEENNNIILSEKKLNYNNQKFLLISLENDIKNNDNEDIVEENNILNDINNKDNKRKIANGNKNQINNNDNQINEILEEENKINISNDEFENKEVNKNENINMEKNKEVELNLNNKPN